MFSGKIVLFCAPFIFYPVDKIPYPYIKLTEFVVFFVFWQPEHNKTERLALVYLWIVSGKMAEMFYVKSLTN